MPSASPPTAATITVRETLALLGGSFNSVVRGIAQNRYALWLGSGISRGRVDDLERLIRRVLDFLQQRVAVGDVNCRFRQALSKIIQLGSPSAAEYAGIDFDRPVREWATLDAIVPRLCGNYAKLLDVPVGAEEVDFLLWDAVDVCDTYADPSACPDCEHLCIAILALEGCASDIATANWDGLIEIALEKLSGRGRVLRVCVFGEDLRIEPLRSSLYKFHGCAVRARMNAAAYRGMLIARQSQIDGWATANVVLRDYLINLVVTKPTLMIGLSAQDHNIRTIFVQAEARMPWRWPGDPPAYIFAENDLGADQQSVLQCVYRNDYTPATRQAIIDSALIKAYAKPLLVAIILHLLCAKLQAFIELVEETGLAEADRVRLIPGLLVLRDRLAENVEPNHLGFTTILIRQSSRILSMFREGKVPAADTLTYQPLGASPIQQMGADPGLATSGLREFAAVIALLGLGLQDGNWALEFVDLGDMTAGALRAVAASGPARLFFVANNHAALKLQVDGNLEQSAPDVVLVHSLAIAPTMTRSPRGAPGRTGRTSGREVSIARLLEQAADVGDLMRLFREKTFL
jgi:hypothetical protein